MKTRFVRNTVILTAIGLLVGAGVAFAHGGWGGYGGGAGGPMMNYRGGPAMGPGGYGAWMHYDNRPYSRLSAEDEAKIAPLRDKFLKETEPLRLKMNEKRFALRQEMIKAKPDEKTALQLQKELSDLRDQLGQKALAYRLELRKVLPEDAYGFGLGRGGYGRGMGGVRGGGYCW